MAVTGMAEGGGSQGVAGPDHGRAGAAIVEPAVAGRTRGLRLNPRSTVEPASPRQNGTLPVLSAGHPSHQSRRRFDQLGQAIGTALLDGAQDQFVDGADQPERIVG